MSGIDFVTREPRIPAIEDIRRRLDRRIAAQRHAEAGRALGIQWTPDRAPIPGSLADAQVMRWEGGRWVV